MALEILKELELAEQRADATLKDAQQEARDMLEQAERSCRERERQGEHKSRELYRDLLNQKKEAVEAQLRIEAEELAREREGQVQAARAKIAQAADFIVQKVLHGNR